jgi:hypothetical protein
MIVDDEPLAVRLLESYVQKTPNLQLLASYTDSIDKIIRVDRNDCIYIGEEIIHVPDGYLETFRNLIKSRSF